MNKRHGIIAVALVALLLATSCSTFFTGGVSGKVKCNGEPVARATVALYFDEGQRNADFDAQNKVFHTDYKTETQENGSFAITNIPWDDAFPEYGKDADSKTAYALVYHKDYGYMKVDNITIISGRSNEFFPEFDKETFKEDTIKLSFINAANVSASSGISSFSYSYEGRPGYDDKIYTVENVAVPANGIVEIPVKYDAEKYKEFPKVRIYDIKASKYDSKNEAYAKPVAYVTDHYEVKDEFTIAFKESDRKVYSIEVMPYIIELSSFSGRIHVDNYLSKDLEVTIAKTSDSTVILDKVIAQPGKSDNLDNSKFYTYEGLGRGITIVNTEFKKDFEEKFNIVINEVDGEPEKAKRTVTVKAVPKTSDYTQTFSI